jgi:hypothetical protein
MVSRMGVEKHEGYIIPKRLRLRMSRGTDGDGENGILLFARLLVRDEE